MPSRAPLPVLSKNKYYILKLKRQKVCKLDKKQKQIFYFKIKTSRYVS
jgi:hypothetical protein